uniref:Uncharacterized protein n=1 Tax=Rhizophora mucronata TaxID=61149 RepID=A0A2P2J247_RHIMU
MINKQIPKIYQLLLLLPWADPGISSLNNATTCNILGLLEEKSSTHCNVISKYLTISLTSSASASSVPLVTDSNSWSITSICLPSPTFNFTQPTKLVSPKSSLSVGRFPVRSSSRTTPNE